MMLDGIIALSHALEKAVKVELSNNLSWVLLEEVMANSAPVGLKWGKHPTVQWLRLVGGVGWQTEYTYPMLSGESDYPRLIVSGMTTKKKK